MARASCWRRHEIRFHIFTVALHALSGCSRAAEKLSAEGLAKAMAANDLDAIRSAVTAARAALGEKAGIPEVADDFKKAPADATMLPREEAQRGFAPHFAQLETMRWWTTGNGILARFARLKVSSP